MSPWFRLLLIAGLLLGGMQVGAIRAQDDDLQPISVQDDCRTAVQGMTRLIEQAHLPSHLLEGEAARKSGDFDVNRFFRVLDQLSVEEGYMIDYVYMYTGTGGHPVLYALAADESPLLTIDDYQALVTTEEGKVDESIISYLNHLLINDTPAGYMQSVIFDTMSNQFYLYWHANYNDWRIICDDDLLDAALDGVLGEVPEEVITAAHEIDLTPTVTLYEDVAEVRVVMFTAWGGVVEWIITIERAFPRTIHEWSYTDLDQYRTSVVF